MRRFLLTAMMCGAITGAISRAHAADLPDFPALRGSVPPSLSTSTRNWDGWYAGGQFGYSTSNVNFTNSVVSLTNNLFRNTTLQQPTSNFNLLGKPNAQTTGFGAFVGRNYQFDDVVLGAEANYTYLSNLVATSKATLGPIQVAEPTLILPPGAVAADSVTLNGTARVQIHDEMTFRARAGWAADDFLPYVFGGLAVGRMDVSRTVTSSVIRTIFNADGSTSSFALPQFSLTTTDARTNNLVLGWTAGLGLEYRLFGGLFMRGEWEYIKFLSVKDTVVSQNSFRAGLGYKF